MTSVKLSPRYSLADLTRSQMAARRGIANVPTPAQVLNLRTLANAILEPVSIHFGVRAQVSSGFRSATLNAAIGGSPSSQHMQGEAVDFTVPGVANRAVLLWIRDNLLFDQLILEPKTVADGAARWVHCSLNLNGPNRREVLGLDENPRP